MIRRPPRSTPFPYTTPFRASHPRGGRLRGGRRPLGGRTARAARARLVRARDRLPDGPRDRPGDRKGTRLTSSHANISYAVFCLHKKNTSFFSYQRMALEV